MEELMTVPEFIEVNTEAFNEFINDYLSLDEMDVKNKRLLIDQIFEIRMDAYKLKDAIITLRDLSIEDNDSANAKIKRLKDFIRWSRNELIKHKLFDAYLMREGK